jgi:hypothetical protein
MGGASFKTPDLINNYRRFGRKNLIALVPLYPDSLKTRQKVLAKLGEQDLSGQHDSPGISEHR